MFRTEIPRFLHSIRPDGHKLSSSSSKTPSLLSRSFDENLLSRLKTLDPPSITFSWLSRAVDLLSSTHADAEALISDLSVSAPEKSLPSYLDDSIKVLDVCNSITAEIERLRQGRLLIHFVLHLLDLSGKDREAPAPENLRKARDSLADWGKSTPAGRKSLSLENSAALIRDLAQAIGSPPRGKVQDVKKTLRRVIYTVGAVTVFVAGAVVAVLVGSPEPIGIRVPSEFLWAERFNDLQMVVSGELRTRFSGSKKRFANERESVEEAVRRVADVIGEAEGGTEKEGMSNAAKELERATEEFSDGLERLLDGVNGFFRVVLCTRNALLKNFRRNKGDNKEAIIYGVQQSNGSDVFENGRNAGDGFEQRRWVNQVGSQGRLVKFDYEIGGLGYYDLIIREMTFGSKHMSYAGSGEIEITLRLLTLVN
ncbi:UPF0496 protein 4-like [Magnolia sinica]|uniref:UPF0496 protein 4-like n=1 Tax=Magnolia sinica TaxID=86752 RepID=UPI002658A4DB|nr:UPF0496 protein 4-like [Magnolia sinica]